MQHWTVSSCTSRIHVSDNAGVDKLSKQPSPMQPNPAEQGSPAHLAVQQQPTAQAGCHSRLVVLVASAALDRNCFLIGVRFLQGFWSSRR